MKELKYGDNDTESIEMNIAMEMREKQDEFIYSVLMPFCEKQEFHISKQELIDAMQLYRSIVRCRDCKFWGKDSVPGETDHVKACQRGFYMVHENGYCVYGDRKPDDPDDTD